MEGPDFREMTHILNLNVLEEPNEFVKFIVQGTVTILLILNHPQHIISNHKMYFIILITFIFNLYFDVK